MFVVCFARETILKTQPTVEHTSRQGKKKNSIGHLKRKCLFGGKNLGDTCLNYKVWL